MIHIYFGSGSPEELDNSGSAGRILQDFSRFFKIYDSLMKKQKGKKA